MGNETAGSGRFKRVSSGRNHAKIKGGGQKGAGGGSFRSAVLLPTWYIVPWPTANCSRLVFLMRVLIEATYLGKRSIAFPPWQPSHHRHAHHIWVVDYCIVCAVFDGLGHTSDYSLSKLSILIIHHLLHA